MRCLPPVLGGGTGSEGTVPSAKKKLKCGFHADDYLPPTGHHWGELLLQPVDLVCGWVVGEKSNSFRFSWCVHPGPGAPDKTGSRHSQATRDVVIRRFARDDEVAKALRTHNTWVSTMRNTLQTAIETMKTCIEAVPAEFQSETKNERTLCGNRMYALKLVLATGSEKVRDPLGPVGDDEEVEVPISRGTVGDHEVFIRLVSLSSEVGRVVHNLCALKVSWFSSFVCVRPVLPFSIV